MKSLFEPSPRQHEVLEFRGNRLLVDGPPGTGKTTIAALKVGQLAQGLVKDQRILFLTFTNNATDRIGEALKENLSPEDRRKVSVLNYHSLFFRMILGWSAWIGLPRRVQLMSDAEHRELYVEAVEAVRKLGVNVRRQNRGVPMWFSKALAWRDGYFGSLSDQQQEALNVASAVKEKVHTTGRLHFDDFDYYALRILRSDRLASTYRRRYPVILVDEFQDINDLQYRVLQKLTSDGHWYCFGDSCQTIYTWAGASQARLSEFETHEKARKITLVRNYRYENCSGITLIAESLRRMATLPQSQWEKVRVRTSDVDFYPCNARPHQFAYAAKILPALNSKEYRIACFVPTNAEVRELSIRFSASKVHHRVMLDDEEHVLWEDVLLAAINVGSSDFWQNLSRTIDHALGARRFREPAGEFELRQLFGAIADAPVTNQIHQVLSSLEQITDGEKIESLRKAAHTILRSIGALEKTQKATPLALTNAVYQRRIQESFRGRSKAARGITVMTMHKAKGKEFDIAFFFAPNIRGFLGGPASSDDEQRAQLTTWHVVASRPRAKLMLFYSQSAISPYLDPFLG